MSHKFSHQLREHWSTTRVGNLGVRVWILIPGCISNMYKGGSVCSAIQVMLHPGTPTTCFILYGHATARARQEETQEQRKQGCQGAYFKVRAKNG